MLKLNNSLNNKEPRPMHRDFSPNLEVMIGKIEIDNSASIYELVNTLYDRLLKLEAENTDLKNKYRLAIEGDKKRRIEWESKSRKRKK